MRNRDGIVLAAAATALTAAPAIAAETTAYRYDARGRLIEIVRSTGAGNVVTTYSYDRAGNRIVKTTTGSPNPGPP